MGNLRKKYLYKDYMNQLAQLNESTWPKITYTSCMLVTTTVALCLFFYYYMI